MLHFITIFVHQGQFTNWELVTLCLSCVYNCSDQSFLHIFLRSSNIWSFICSLIGILHHLQVYCELTKWQAPSWLVRPLHLYSRGHGFESCSSLIFFQASISQLLKLCVTAMILMSSHRSPQFKYIIFHIFICKPILVYVSAYFYM